MHEDRYLFRRLIAIGLALLALGFFASRDNPNTQSLFDRPSDLESFIDRARDASYEVNCNGRTGSGWGYRTEVDGEVYEFIVTNQHVIKFCIIDQDAEVIRQDGVSAGVEIVAHKRVLATYYNDLQAVDLALLKFPAPLEAPLTQLASEHPQGSWLLISSFPVLAADLTNHQITTGAITGETLQWGFTTDAISSGGSSGGVVLNSRGQVLGTHYATFSKRDRATYSMFLDNDYLDELVELAIKKAKQEPKGSK